MHFQWNTAMVFSKTSNSLKLAIHQNLSYNCHFIGPWWWWSSGQLARLLSDDPSSNPTNVNSFSLKICV